MMTPRTITVTLTKAQYSELAAAVAQQDVALEDQQNVGDSSAGRRRAVLERGWRSISAAWYAKEQR